MEELQWYGWKDIELSGELVGETIKKGSGMWEKEYTYIKIPNGYGYDNYCFLLSDKCVHINSDNTWYFSICHDMKLELVYDTELREEGKRYKRYQMTGYDLFETIFKDYELKFIEEMEKRFREAVARKEKLNKANQGKVICGIYTGNVYAHIDPKYQSNLSLRAYFIGDNNSTYCNHKYDKIRNVNRVCVIYEGISKHQFLQWEDIINAYLQDYEVLYKVRLDIERHLVLKKEKNISKLLLKYTPELLVVTDTEEILQKQIEICKESMEAIKLKLTERITQLIKASGEG